MSSLPMIILSTLLWKNLRYLQDFLKDTTMKFNMSGKNKFVVRISKMINNNTKYKLVREIQEIDKITENSIDMFASGNVEERKLNG